MKTVRLKISGQVQGVMFRNFIKNEADKLEIKGHVRNLDSGEVEVIVEGSPEIVDRIISVCRKGSPQSVVKNVDIQEMNHIGFDDFKILSI